MNLVHQQAIIPRDGLLMVAEERGTPDEFRQKAPCFNNTSPDHLTGCYGCGGAQPRPSRYGPNLCSILENCVVISAPQSRAWKSGGSHDALSLKGDHAVLDPETIAAHHIGQHDVGG